MAAAAREKFMALQAEQQQPTMSASRTLSNNSSLAKGGKGSTNNLLQQVADPMAATLPSTATGPTASPTPVELDSEKQNRAPMVDVPQSADSGEKGPEVAAEPTKSASSSTGGGINKSTVESQSADAASTPVATSTAATTVVDPNAAIIALGWQVHNDKKTGRDYYFNPITKETKWQRPNVDATNSSSVGAAGGGAKPSSLTAKQTSTTNVPQTATTISPSSGGTESAPIPSAAAAKNLFENKAAAASKLPQTGTVPATTNNKAPPLAPTKVSEGNKLTNAAALNSPFGASIANSKLGNIASKNISNTPGSPTTIQGSVVNNKEKKAAEKHSVTTAVNSGSTPTASETVPTATDPSDALKTLLEQNKQLQAMIAAGMNGPIALDFGGKLDALTKTNTALTIQMNRLQTEHTAMLKALTEANVKVHQLQQQLEEERAINTARLGGAAYASNTVMSLTKEGEASEVGVAMAHLRETNRNLVQQVGELSTLLARSLADQSFVAAASLSGPQTAGSGGGGRAATVATASTEHNANASPNSKELYDFQRSLTAPMSSASIPSPDVATSAATYYPGYQSLIKSNPLAPPPSATNTFSPMGDLFSHQQKLATSNGPPFPQSYLATSRGPAHNNYNAINNSYSPSGDADGRPQYEGIYEKQQHPHQPRSNSLTGSRRSASPPFVQQQGYHHPILRSGSAYGTRSPSLGGGSAGQSATNKALMFGGFVIRSPAYGSGK